MTDTLDSELNIEGLREYFEELAHDCDFDDWNRMRCNVEQDLYTEPKERWVNWIEED